MFSLDGPIYRISLTIYKYLVLNLLFLVFCIPIVTIPAASGALFAVVRKEVYREEPALIRSFWKGLKDNWRRSSILGLPFLIIGCMWWLDVRVITQSHVRLGSITPLLMLLVPIILVSILIHLFPLMVHVHSTPKQLFIDAVKLTMIKPHLTLVNLLAIVAMLLLSTKFMILFVACFFSLTATLTYWLVNRKFVYVGAIYQKSS